MVDEVDRIVGLSGLLEEGIGQVKQRDRGVTGAQTLVAMAAAQLTGQDHLVGLDRRRSDAAGQPLGPAVDVPSTTAAQIAKRFTDSAFWGIEEAVGRACARVLDRLAPVRRAELLRSVTLDGDATDIEVYGAKKQGAEHAYTGARRLQADIVCWAELGVPLACDLLDGREDARAGIVDRLTRAVHALPEAVAEINARFDTGYFAVDLARACVQMGVRFAIGVRRNSAVLRQVQAVPEAAWSEATGMDGTQVAVMEYLPDAWAKDPDIAKDAKACPVACLARRTRLEAADLPTERARKRRRIHPDQLALALDGVIDHVYLYSFILTNRDVATPAKAAEVEAWYRRRTDIEALNRDAKHGAALRHMPSGDKTVNRLWCAAALLTCTLSAFLQELAGPILGRSRMTIARLRRELICVPARVRHARDGTIWLHPPPGFPLLDHVLTSLQAHGDAA